MRVEEFETLRSLPTVSCKRILGITERCGSAHVRTAVAFAALASKQCSAPYFDDLSRLLDQIAGGEQIRRALERLLRAKDLPVIRRLSRDYGVDELTSFILFCDDGGCGHSADCSAVPQSVLLLSRLFLNPDPEQSVADLACGSGSFMVGAFPELGERSVAAFETDRDKAAAALLRCFILGPNFRVLCRDVVSSPGEGRYDRVFVHPDDDMLKARVEFRPGPAKADDTAELPPSTSMTKGWLFAGTAVNMLKAGGKAIVVVSANMLVHRADSAVRSAYVRSGLVESVILLPDTAAAGTNAPCAILILSSGNDSVRMVDARRCAARRGREYVPEVDDVSRIIDGTDDAGARARYVPCSRIAEADWSLLPTRYLDERVIPHGRPLEEICTRIERGAQISVNKLEEIKSDTPTNCRYLRIADIEDGIVGADSSAEYLTSLPEAAKKRCIRDGTLVLSRQGTPSYKSGVAHVAEDECVLAPGNVYLIDVDPDIADPYFLQAFLQSETGIASLKQLGGASAVSPISLADLRKLIVPVPPLDVQKQVAEEYRKTSSDCLRLRSELAGSRSRLSSIYDMSFGETEYVPG